VIEIDSDLMGSLSSLAIGLGLDSRAIFLVPALAFCEALLGLGLFISGAFLLATAMITYSAQPDSLPLILILAFLGAFSADTIGYFSGYLFSDTINKTAFMRKYRKAREKFSSLVDRSMLLAICAGRLTPFLRSVTPFLAGSMGLRPARFLVFDVIACTIWVSGLASILLLIPGNVN